MILKISDYMEEKYPSLAARIQSTFIDTFLLIFIMFLVSRVLEHFSEAPDWTIAAIFVVLLAYEPVCMSLGCTLGNFIKGIRVRKFSDPSKRINILQALLRYPIKLMLGWVSFLTIHSTEKRRAIHDLVSGSVMIKL